MYSRRTIVLGVLQPDGVLLCDVNYSLMVSSMFSTAVLASCAVKPGAE